MRYVLFLILFGCGLPHKPSTTKVIEGEDAVAPEYFASLFYKGEKTPFCGGSFIQKDLVITAAHCVNNLDRGIEVRRAVSSLDHLPKALEVEAVRPHPEFHSSRITSDIALVYLRKESELRPIPISRERKPDGLRVYGLGATDPRADEGAFPRNLQTALLKEVPIYECRTLAYPFQDLNAQQICADDFEGNSDSCYGDSGGPLVTTGDEELYGLVSWGISCGKVNTPGVYTRVSSYGDWLDKDDFDLGEKITYAFYHPLEYEQKRFSAKFHVWQSTGSFSPTQVLNQWTGHFRQEVFRLELLSQGPKRYLFRLQYDGKTYFSTASFTELNPMPSD